jgi:hypothetical protein
MSKSAAELRAEVKSLRQSHPDHMPVSKMKKADLSSLLEKLKHNTETTPMMAQEKKVMKAPKGEVIQMPKEMIAADKPMKAPKKAKKHAEQISVSDEEEKPMKAMKEKKEKKESHVKSKSHVTSKSHVKEDDKKTKMKEKMAKIRAMKGKKKAE